MRYRILTAALLTGLVVIPARAQSPQTFYACYVPDVGATYMIKLPGTPTQCLSTSHQEISWTDGSEIADGSVTTSKLADGAVTSSKIVADVPLPPASCSTDQIIKWDGSAWVCAHEPGFAGYEWVATAFTRNHTDNDLHTETFVANCPVGKDVLGGVYHW